jgi:hypothetical protein
MIPDRGSEGTLISYYYAAPRLIRQIRAAYGKDARAFGDGTKAADAPPAPAEKRRPGR